MNYKSRLSELDNLKYSLEEIRSLILKEIEELDILIFNKLEAYYCDNKYDEYQEIIEIIKNQLPNINFTNKYLKNITAKSIETIFRDRISLFINFIKELKSTLKYIFNQNSPFTSIKVNAYRKNSIVNSEKLLDVQLLLDKDIAEYLEIIDTKNNLNYTYKTKDYQRLKKLDEKIPEIIYFLNNNIALNDAEINSNNIETIENSNITPVNSLITNQEHSESNLSLNEIVKLAIKKNIADIYGNVYLSHLKRLENILYKEENNIFNFDISYSENKKKFSEYVESNLLTIKKLFNLITRITSNFTEINSVLKDHGDEFIYNKADFINLNELFTDTLNIDLYYIRIIDQQKFNETKDEIEYLYVAYEKLYSDITGNIFDTQTITIKKTLLKEVIEAPEIVVQIEEPVIYDDEMNNKIQSELIKIKTNLEENLKSLNSLINQNICNNSNKNELIRINDSIFKIIRKKELFKPLFYYKFNSLTGENEIIINLSNENYKSEYEEFIINMACSLFYTKSTMTSNTIDIFINRLLSNLTLIQ